MILRRRTAVVISAASPALSARAQPGAALRRGAARRGKL